MKISPVLRLGPWLWCPLLLGSKIRLAARSWSQLARWTAHSTHSPPSGWSFFTPACSSTLTSLIYYSLNNYALCHSSHLPRSFLFPFSTYLLNCNSCMLACPLTLILSMTNIWIIALVTGLHNMKLLTIYSCMSYVIKCCNIAVPRDLIKWFKCQYIDINSKFYLTRCSSKC